MAEKKGGKTIFTTIATPVDNQSSVSTELTASKKVSTSTVNTFTKPCLFCQGEHSMAHCKKMRKSFHKEKLDFLCGKGLCFSCLQQGHMSKFCEDKLNCETCSLTHPTVLHMKNKDKVTLKKEPSEDGKRQSVINGFVDTSNKISSVTGAGDTDSILAIVPVQVKVKNGS